MAPVAGKNNHTTPRNGPLESSSIAKFISIEVQVLGSVQEGGGDVMTTPHLGLSYSKGGIRRGSDCHEKSIK